MKGDVKVIYKYSTNNIMSAPLVLEMDVFAEFLCMKEQHGVCQMWFLQNKEPKHRHTKKFILIGTGLPFVVPKGKDYVYLDTVLLHQGSLVLHLFEIVDIPSDDDEIVNMILNS